ncbi:MAG: hypothetical protein KDK08_27015 [Rhizobiaceae bacterium]|nr:hypothetical protein [Rhizobiaceae bacterium]
MAKEQREPRERLAKDIRRQIGTQANATFLRRLPVFAINDELPDELNALLGQLDKVERSEGRDRNRA